MVRMGRRMEAIDGTRQAADGLRFDHKTIPL
jgi:hypothetical protein